MRIAKGVEWSAHACVLLCALSEGKGLKAEAIGEYLDVPKAYMAKQMQALRRAGIVKSVQGKRGGYRLARNPVDISLWDIHAAIEGTRPAFRCMEIRQNGPCPTPTTACKEPCTIATAFYAAETAFRESLKAVTLATVASGIATSSTPEQFMKVVAWLSSNAD